MTSRLQCLVVGEPVADNAELITRQCRRLADERVIASSGEEVINACRHHRPEMVLLSLDIPRPKAVEVAKGLRRDMPGVYLVALYRELGVNMVDKLEKAGFDDLIPQPLERTELFRLASARFQKPFRQHHRYDVSIEVHRADGVMIGRTIDLSEGGMRLQAVHPLSARDSLLVHLGVLDEASSKVQVRCQILEVVGEPPQTVTARAMFENLRGEEYRRLQAFLLQLTDHGSYPGR